MTPRAPILSTLLLAWTAAAAAQEPHSHPAGAAAAHGAMHRAAGAAGAPADPSPSAPGQAAFGALAEIVRLLEADPATDWSRVSIVRLREHLRDMDDVVLRAEVVERPVDGGVEIEVTGSGRTLEAIGRMVPAHAAMLRAERPWTIAVEERPQGFLLTVTAADPAEAVKLRGLGFFGLLASGDHHRPHHLAMARGS